MILATGFENLYRNPLDGKEDIPILSKIIHFYTNDEGKFEIERNYNVKSKNDRCPQLILNGMTASSHGIAGAGTFSTISLRSDLISSSIEKTIRAKR